MSVERCRASPSTSAQPCQCGASACEREDAGIDQRIADQPLGRLLAEAGFVGRAVDRRELAPGVMIVAHRAMDLRRHGERAGARGARGTARSRRPAAPSNRHRSRDRDRSPGSSAAGKAAPSAPCSRPSTCRGRESRSPTAARPRSRPGRGTRRAAPPSGRNRGCPAPARGLPSVARSEPMQSLHQVEIAGVAAGDRDGLVPTRGEGWRIGLCCRLPFATVAHGGNHGQARRLLRLARIRPGPISASKRFEAIAKKHGADVTIWPVDFGSVFAVSGGLPLPKRAPQRQAYRMMELKRWRDHLGVKLTLEPKFFPGQRSAGRASA